MIVIALASALLSQQTPFAGWPNSELIGDLPKEVHLKNVRQLTFGGQNAEAYWNVDGTQIVFQTRQPQWPDEQIIVMNADGSNKRLVSTGKGRCTCGYFTPDGKYIYFSSTHEKNEGAQPPLDFSKGYVWMVNPQFSMYRVRMTPIIPGEMAEPGPGSAKPEKVLDLNEYVAETTISPNGREMFFTSAYEEDLEIYKADLDGKKISRLTRQVGYDGGPFVSWDGEKVVYRRAHLQFPKQIREYKDLLKEHLVRPLWLEIYIMNSSGRFKRQVTSMGAASFAPFLFPDNKRVIFASNFGDKKGREFELWMIDVDGTRLRRVTYSPEFDGFPMFTRDGKKLVWASNRNGKMHGETNIFVADWVD
jgi:TolB protein